MNLAANALKEKFGVDINAVDHKDLSPNALKGNDEMNSVDKDTLAPNALKDRTTGPNGGRINPVDQDDLDPDAL